MGKLEKELAAAEAALAAWDAEHAEESRAADAAKEAAEAAESAAVDRCTAHHEIVVARVEPEAERVTTALLGMPRTEAATKQWGRLVVCESRRFGGRGRVSEDPWAEAHNRIRNALVADALEADAEWKPLKAEQDRCRKACRDARDAQHRLWCERQRLAGAVRDVRERMSKALARRDYVESRKPDPAAPPANLATAEEKARAKSALEMDDDALLARIKAL